MKLIRNHINKKHPKGTFITGKLQSNEVNLKKEFAFTINVFSLVIFVFYNSE